MKNPITSRLLYISGGVFGALIPSFSYPYLGWIIAGCAASLIIATLFDHNDL